MYDQSTYKPPSLYPNKRTRTDSGWDGQEGERKKTDGSYGTLPYMNTRPDDRSMHQPLELPILGGSSPVSYRHTPVAQSHGASPEHRGRSVHVPASPRLALPQRFSGQSKTAFHFQPPPQSHSQREMHIDGTLNPYDSTRVSQSRSPSISLAEDAARRSTGYGSHGPQHSYGPDSRHQASLLPSGQSVGYRDDYPALSRLDGSHGYNGVSYPYAQAFFVPSHYEYQNGKSRKRSNLPKQSTEIMKRWFGEMT